MRKRTLSLALAVSMAAMSLAGCGGGGGTTATTAAAGGETTAAASEAATEAASTDDSNLSDVEKIIKEAEGMSMEELAKKAIEESNGKTFYGVGNSSRGKSALPLFIEYLQSIDPSWIRVIAKVPSVFKESAVSCSKILLFFGCCHSYSIL